MTLFTGQPLLHGPLHGHTSRLSHTSAVQRDHHLGIVYSRAELLGVSPALLPASVAEKLRALHIGRSLPRKRSRRGGVRKLSHRNNGIKVLPT